jgi:hypothetical protein
VTLKDKFIVLEEEFVLLWAEYMKLNDELNTYRGKDIGDNVEKVNKLIYDIQDTFQKIYPILSFVVKRATFCTQALHDYDKFIEDIKKAGAQEVDMREQ